MTHVNETVVRYIAAWNERDPKRRRELVGEHMIDTHRDYEPQRRERDAVQHAPNHSITAARIGESGAAGRPAMGSVVGDEAQAPVIRHHAG